MTLKELDKLELQLSRAKRATNNPLLLVDANEAIARHNEFLLQCARRVLMEQKEMPFD